MSKGWTARATKNAISPQFIGTAPEIVSKPKSAGVEDGPTIYVNSPKEDISGKLINASIITATTKLEEAMATANRKQHTRYNWNEETMPEI